MPLRRLLLIGTLTAAAACWVKTYHDLPPAEVALDEQLNNILRHTGDPVWVRLEYEDGRVVTGELKKVNLEANTVTLLSDSAGAESEIDFSHIVRAEIGDVNLGLSLLAGLGAVVLIAGAAYGGVSLLAFLATVLPVISIKASSPFVYVQTPEGMRLVGEVYSGAALGALQRQDLLALPPVSGERLQIRLADRAHEIQYTDLAQLLVVDHPADARALATMDGQSLLVGRSVQGTATDLEGHDLGPMLSTADGIAWTSDLDALARQAHATGEEGILLMTDAAPSNAALELTYANRPWMDLVAGRLWEGLGPRLATVQQADRDPSQRARLEEKLRLAGVYTAVELETPTSWETVAWLPPPGWAAFRHVAVPLPGISPGQPATIRLRGGAGFLSVDAVALTSILQDSPTETVVEVNRAVQLDGQDVREALRRVDGTYQVLPDRGSQVDLSFSLPPPRTGMRRDLFLKVDGYYEVLPRSDAPTEMAAAHILANHPEDAGKFSLALYRSLVGTP